MVCNYCDSDKELYLLIIYKDDKREWLKDVKIFYSYNDMKRYKKLKNVNKNFIKEWSNRIEDISKLKCDTCGHKL